MDAEEQRRELARLESDYLQGALTAEDYVRLREHLLGDEPAPTLAVPGREAVTDEPLPGADPVTGQPLASWGRRGAAWFVDVLVLAAVWTAVLVWSVTTEDPATGEISDGAALAVSAGLLFAPPIYQWLMVGTWGRTVGKMAVGVTVVRAETADRVSYGRALGRAASVWVLGIFSIPLLLAYLWPLWDRRNQTLYDKMAGTIVIRG